MSDDASYYVYALKDPRYSPAAPFYIGKGVGTRSHDHLVRPDATRKGRRIEEIVAAGAKVLVARLVDSLTELQALKLEAELISAFGTVDTGGLLTNSVLPSGLAVKARPSLVLPSGAKEKAQLGLALLKEAGHFKFRCCKPSRSQERLRRWLEGLPLVQRHWPIDA